MTFTFTLDAFPDYTKFDRTHKVLAAIQVIIDKFEEKEEERTVCYPISIKEITKGIEVTFDNDSTDADTKITVKGNSVNGVTYTTANWGTSLPEDVYIAEFDINIPVENGKKYRLITRSPLHQYYKDDDRIEEETPGHFYKKQEITATGDTYPLTMGISNKPGDITLEMYEITDDGDKFIRKITVYNDIEFAKRCKITVNDDDEKMKNLAINGETVQNFDKVVSGDELCFAADNAKVTVNNRAITKNTEGFYIIDVTGNTTITVV